MPDSEFGDEESTTADALLDRPIDSVRYPRLAAVLAGPQGSVLRGELVDLLRPHLHARAQLHARAPRQSMRVMCRLTGANYDEPVLLKDISASGVRFLVQSDVALDLTQFGNMQLHVRIDDGPRSLAVALVRRCGGDAHHTDLACRFLSPDSDHQRLVTEIRSRIFGDEPTIVPEG